MIIDNLKCGITLFHVYVNHSITVLSKKNQKMFNLHEIHHGPSKILHTRIKG